MKGPWAEPGDIGQTAPGGDFVALRFGLLTADLAKHSLPFNAWLVREERAPAAEPSPADPSAVKIEFGVQTQQPSDWLTLGIPVRALAVTRPVDNSWSVESQPWLLPLCRALAAVADHVHARAPVLGGVVGEETSGCWRVPTQTRAGEAEQGYPPLAVLSAEAIEERGGFLVTPDLWRRLETSRRCGRPALHAALRAPEASRAPHRRLSSASVRASRTLNALSCSDPNVGAPRR